MINIDEIKKALNKDDVSYFEGLDPKDVNAIIQFNRLEDPSPILIYAIRKNAKKIFDKLIEKKADVNFKSKFNCTPLLEAISCKRIYYIKKLIDNGADIELIGGKATTWPLLDAIINGNIEIIEILLQKAEKKYIQWGIENIKTMKIKNKKEIEKLLNHYLGK